MQKKPAKKPRSQLIEARLRRHLTQEQLADLLGTTSLNVGRWERGLTTPSAYYRHKLCEVFTLSADDLDILPTLPNGKESALDEVEVEQVTVFPLQEPPSAHVFPFSSIGDQQERKDPPGDLFSHKKRPRRPSRILPRAWQIGITIAVGVAIAALLLLNGLRTTGLTDSSLKSSYHGIARCLSGCSSDDPFEILIDSQDQHGDITARWIYTSPPHTAYSCKGTVAQEKHLTFRCTGGLQGYVLSIQGSLSPDGHLEGIYHAVSPSGHDVERSWTAS